MTKTKRFSRIITFVLAMLMVVAMAVPAFAATLERFTYIRPYTIFDMRMGVSGTIGNDAPVKLVNNYNIDSQKFIITKFPDGSYRIASRLGYQSTNKNVSYTLNAYRSGEWPCTMLLGANNRSDSEIDVRTIDSISFRILLLQHSRYLTQNGLNQSMTWGSYADAYTKAWVQVAT